MPGPARLQNKRCAQACLWPACYLFTGKSCHSVSQSCARPRVADSIILKAESVYQRYSYVQLQLLRLPLRRDRRQPTVFAEHRAITCSSQSRKRRHGPQRNAESPVKQACHVPHLATNRNTHAGLRKLGQWTLASLHAFNFSGCYSNRSQAGWAANIFLTHSNTCHMRIRLR